MNATSHHPACRERCALADGAAEFVGDRPQGLDALARNRAFVDGYTEAELRVELADRARWDVGLNDAEVERLIGIFTRVRCGAAAA